MSSAKAEEYMRSRYKADWDGPMPIVVAGFRRRIELPRLAHFLGAKRGAEIGVAAGRNLEYICRRIPGIHMIGVDFWRKYAVDRDGTPCSHGRNAKKDYVRAVKVAGLYGAELIRKSSMEAAKDIPDESLDFVYIDANHHYAYVMEDLVEWSKKVRPGGIVSGHDYFSSPNADVIQAVNEYVKAHGIDRWYITGESVPSYFWVKP